MSKQPIAERTCSRCEVEKPLQAFYNSERTYCIECERVTARERMKCYNGTFRGKASQALQDSRKAVKRIELEQGMEVEDTLTLIDVLWVLSEKECAYCGEEIEEKSRTLDHITPMKYYGGNTFSNVTMACASCNRIKNDLPVIMHMIREETDERQALQLFERMASRSNRTFSEVFEQLSKDARTYFEHRTVLAIERIKESEERDGTA